MTGVTIDHLISTTAFIAAILIFTGLFAQTLQGALLYQQNRHVALKASELIDNIMLSPGYPYNWGITNSTLSCFGLQERGMSGYVLNSFALMRLTSNVGDPVEYPRDSGKWYNNVSLGPTGFLFVPLSDSVTYETASKLLGTNGSYGFELKIQPLVRVLITEHQTNPLILKVEVSGPGFPLVGADIGYYFYRSYPTVQYASIEVTTGNAVTDSTGVAYLNFPLDGAKETYTIVVHTSLSGLNGLGHYTHKTFTQGAGVIPFVVDYESGQIYLAHSWDVHDQGVPVPDYKFNATFFILTDDFEFQEWPIANSTGGLNYGFKNYEITTLPMAHPGFLLVTYRSGNNYGMSIMPWGMGTIAAPISFGGNPEGNVWTATDLRQVIVEDIQYQAKITCWSLEGYQIWESNPWWS